MDRNGLRSSLRLALVRFDQHQRLTSDMRMKKKINLKVIPLIWGLCFGFAHAGLDDFDVSKSRIDLSDVVSGGPGKDGIPAISKPRFLPASDAGFLRDNDLVVGISIGGEKRAYPLGILNRHEIVNDVVGGTPVAVTYCPLTISALVFNRKVDGETLEFGVSGLLYNNNLVMYDRTYSGLWPQLLMEAATGKFSSRSLEVIPSLVTTWREWRTRHPASVVLSEDTGYRRNYGMNPYRKYQAGSEVMFPMKGFDRRLPPKSRIIGIRVNGAAKAYPLENITSRQDTLEDTLNGKRIQVHSGPKETACITDAGGNLLPAFITYWFAWSTLYRDTLLFKEKQQVD